MSGKYSFPSALHPSSQFGQSFNYPNGNNNYYSLNPRSAAPSASQIHGSGSGNGIYENESGNTFNDTIDFLLLSLSFPFNQLL